MSVSGGPDVVQDGLVLYVDTFNPRSYVSGSANWNAVVGGVTASVRGISTDGTLLKANPLVVSSSSGIGAVSSIVFPISSSVPNIYFDDRASRFTLSVWASVQQLDVDPSGNTARGIFSRGAYGGYVGIHASKLTTASATTVAVGTRGIAVSRVVTLANSITTGSVGTAQIFNAVLVCDSSSLYGYFNGNYVGTVNAGDVETLYFTGSQWYCNSYGGVGGNGGAGTMSLYVASIHNRALSAREVLQNFNAQRSRFGV